MAIAFACVQESGKQVGQVVNWKFELKTLTG